MRFTVSNFLELLEVSTSLGLSLIAHCSSLGVSQ